MANGSSDMANRLGLRVEGMSLPWIKHELPPFEAALNQMPETERATMKPVLIVGAGLSAADAVTICRQSEVPVIHVYRNRTAGLDKMLPENIYPEYHEVHKMMKDSNHRYDYYTPMPEHAIADVHPVTVGPGIHRVTVRHLVTGELKTLDVSYCAILIGARPDLRFLHPASVRAPAAPPLKLIESADQKPVTPVAVVECYAPVEEEDCCSPTADKVSSRLARQMSWLKVLCAKCRHLNLCERATKRSGDYKRICGHNFVRCECPGSLTARVGAKPDLRHADPVLGIGEDPLKAIDGKNNPIAVDKYTNQVTRAPKGLFAMGPLVGDNFVRFIPGGALAITAALHREND